MSLLRRGGGADATACGRRAAASRAGPPPPRAPERMPPGRLNNRDNIVWAVDSGGAPRDSLIGRNKSLWGCGKQGF